MAANSLEAHTVLWNIYDYLMIIFINHSPYIGVVLDDFTKMVQHSEIPVGERYTEKHRYIMSS